MAFVDEARIHVGAGKGGDGSASFHHEPFKPKGGPDGGDGGEGGSIILKADRSVGTLLELRDHPHVKAAPGEPGRKSRRHGARGRDRVVLVPLGTVVNTDDGTLVADLALAGDEYVAARGGRGGRGNVRFATSTRRAPSFSEKGEPGEERSLRLELRLLADVGLVGWPNAGKSTLISRVSSAKPKIADYPFTTLVPNLGVVKAGDESFVMADIPGLIPGAHEGKGLGDRFLRHISRAAVLVYIVDLAAMDRDPAGDVDALKLELGNFDPGLLERPSIVVLNKVDAFPDDGAELLKAMPGALAISAVSGEGVDRLLTRLAARVHEARAATGGERASFVRYISRPEAVKVAREGAAWRVSGSEPERVVAITDLDNDEAVARLQKRLLRLGVERALEAAGARAGDEVRIGDAQFDFEPESGAANG
ncbi:MAG TPA: GTPase ObgE [Actinomycetota bacterium]|nr:GTPase ObgE [Actinomycetota bacterium]